MRLSSWNSTGLIGSVAVVPELVSFGSGSDPRTSPLSSTVRWLSSGISAGEYAKDSLIWPPVTTSSRRTEKGRLPSPCTPIRRIGELAPRSRRVSTWVRVEPCGVVVVGAVGEPGPEGPVPTAGPGSPGWFGGVMLEGAVAPGTLGAGAGTGTCRSE